MRILIAEKDPNGRRLLEQMMRMEGYEVFVAQGKQAKNLISELQPDIILMNVFNPLQSGKEPLEQVRICCDEGTESTIYVTCIGQCKELSFTDNACESSHSLFDHLPSNLKINIVDRIQRLCIALKQLKRWLVTQSGCSLEKTFSLDELESYTLQRIMRCS